MEAEERPWRKSRGGLPDKHTYITMGLRLGFTAEHLAAEYDRVMGPTPHPATGRPT